MATIQINHMTKCYGQKKVLDIDALQFQNGYVYGLLGSNGAGKTTLISLITNRAFPTSGEILVDGAAARENEAVQERIFCITEKANYPTDLKVRDLFYWVKAFYSDFSTPYANELAKKFDLDTAKTLKSLSTGYNTILKTILTLASNTEIMILDEPVLGIDSLYRDIFYDVLTAHHKKRRNLIIIATHLIDEVERVLERVVIISEGNILKNCPVNDLTGNVRRLNEVYVDILKERRREHE